MAYALTVPPAVGYQVTLPRVIRVLTLGWSDVPVTPPPTRPTVGQIWPRTKRNL